MVVKGKDPEKQTTRSRTTVVKQYWNEFWSEENKRNRNKWLGGITFGIAVLLLLFVFFKLYRGWRPLAPEKSEISVVAPDPATFIPSPLVIPECRPGVGQRLCLSDTTGNAVMGINDTILVDTLSLPVNSTLCERADTTVSSKVTCRPFVVLR